MSSEPSFLEELDENQKHVRKCGLSQALLSMDDDFREEVLEALRDPSYQSTTIATALKRRDYRVNEWTLRKCRKSCDCGVIFPIDSERE